VEHEQKGFREIRGFCQAHADAVGAQKYSRHFTEGYDPYGLTQAAMEAQRDAWLEQYGERLDLERTLRL